MSAVSVVIPTYNRSQLLKRAIESALSQDVDNIEVIVADDGSDDATPEVAKQYGVKYIRLSHRGVSHARNAAIKASRYPIIAFLDDDDYWLDGYLKTALERLSRDDVCGVFTNYYKVYPNGERQLGYKDGKVPARVGLKWILKGSFIDPSMVCIKKQVLLRAGLFDESLSVTEDWDLWLRVLRLCEFAYIDKPLVCKRIVPDDGLPYRTWYHNCAVIEKFMSSLDERTKKSVQQTLNRTAVKVFSRYATALLHKGEMSQARNYFKKALKIDPLYVKSVFRLCLTYLPYPVARMFDGTIFRRLRLRVKKLKYGREA